MINKNVMAALRRDVIFVWNAVIAVIFIGFAGLAVVATLLALDLLSINHYCRHVAAARGSLAKY